MRPIVARGVVARQSSFVTREPIESRDFGNSRHRRPSRARVEREPRARVIPGKPIDAIDGRAWDRIDRLDRIDRIDRSAARDVRRSDDATTRRDGDDPAARGAARDDDGPAARDGRCLGMNDLLAAVGATNVYDGDARARANASNGSNDVADVELGTRDAGGRGTTTASDGTVATTSTTSEDLMSTFFGDVQAVKSNMTQIRAALRALHDEHEASKRATSAEETRERQDRMNATIESVSKIARETKLRLENLDEDNEKALKSGKIAQGSSEHRTRAALTSSMKTKLKEQMGEFQNLRERLREEYKEIVERRYFAVTGTEAKEEDVERLIETGESETMFQTALLEQGRGQILDTVNEIQERHNAILELERKLLELNQVFLDMSVLVEAQGEMIDNVESHVARSVEYVQQGHVELKKARAYQKNTRKWTCIVIVILMTILISVLLPVLKPWKSGSA